MNSCTDWSQDSKGFWEESTYNNKMYKGMYYGYLKCAHGTWEIAFIKFKITTNSMIFSRLISPHPMMFPGFGTFFKFHDFARSGKGFLHFPGSHDFSRGWKPCYNCLVIMCLADFSEHWHTHPWHRIKWLRARGPVFLAAWFHLDISSVVALWCFSFASFVWLAVCFYNKLYHSQYILKTNRCCDRHRRVGVR